LNGVVGIKSIRDPMFTVLVSVTTPPEIIPYYHLNHSLWSLSDSKEESH
jgi:hypothetical protein